MKMVGFICPRCGYNAQKSDLKKHLNRKTLCKLKHLDIDPREYKVAILGGDVTPLLTEIVELRNEVKKLKENPRGTTINNIDNSVNNTINIETVNIYKINAFGSNEPYFITDEECLQLVNNLTPEDVVAETSKLIHYNEEHPEEKNVYVSSLQSKVAHCYNGDGWEVAPKEETFDTMISEVSPIVCKSSKGFDVMMKVKEEDVKKKVYEKLNILAYNNRPKEE